MTKPGPKQQPLAILKQKGTGNVTRLKEMEKDVDALDFVHNGLPTPPEDFPPLAVQLWNKVLGQAQNLYGYISFIDLVLFEEYCLTYAMMRSIRMRIAKPPQDFEPRLEWGNYHKLTTRFDKLSAEFGLSPSSRTGIKLIQKKKAEQISEYEL